MRSIFFSSRGTETVSNTLARSKNTLRHLRFLSRFLASQFSDQIRQPYGRILCGSDDARRLRKNQFTFRKQVNLLLILFSSIAERSGRTDIGLQLLTIRLSPALQIGWNKALLKTLGSIPVSIARLHIEVRGGTITCLASFNNFVGILSQQVEQSFMTCCIIDSCSAKLLTLGILEYLDTHQPYCLSDTSFASSSLILEPISIYF